MLLYVAVVVCFSYSCFLNFLDLLQFKGLPFNAAGLDGGAGIYVGLPSGHAVQSPTQCGDEIG